MIDAPIALFVGIRQRAARHMAADAKVIELAGMSAKTDFDIAQAVAKGQLDLPRFRGEVRSWDQRIWFDAVSSFQRAGDAMHRPLRREHAIMPRSMQPNGRGRVILAAANVLALALLNEARRPDFADDTVGPTVARFSALCDAFG